MNVQHSCWRPNHPPTARPCWRSMRRHYHLQEIQQMGAVVRQDMCHMSSRGDLGVNVAPDISDSRVKTPAQILTDVLDPNRAIDNNYFGYSILQRDGQVHTGVVSAETASSVTLLQPEGKVVTVLREEIEQMASSGMSLMPVGLEKNLTVQQMADLISFVKNWALPRRTGSCRCDPVIQRITDHRR